MKLFHHLFSKVIVALVVFVMPACSFIAEAEAGTKWELKDTVLNDNNPDNCPPQLLGGGSIPWYYPEPRYEGKREAHSISEGAVTYKNKHVDWGVLYWDVSVNVDFTKPPRVMIGGESLPFKATISGSGFVDEELTHWNQMCVRFGYQEYGWGYFDARHETNSLCLDRQSDTITPNFLVPNGNKGDELSIIAGFSTGGCSVKWVYEAKHGVDDIDSEWIDMEREGWKAGAGPQSPEWCEKIEQDYADLNEAGLWHGVGLRFKAAGGGC